LARRPRLTQLRSVADLADASRPLSGSVVHGLDLSGAALDWATLDVRGTVFLGCRFPSPEVEHALLLRGAVVFPRFEGLPYDPYRAALYTPEELMAGYQRGRLDTTADYAIYRHFVEQGRHDADVLEALAQRIHDHAVDGALREVLALVPESEAPGEGARLPGRRVVAVMGGHGRRRDDPEYRRVAHLAWRLARAGYFVASGGGPGIMEATNLGAWLSRWDDVAVVDEAIGMLTTVPFFMEGGVFLPEYLDTAQSVRARFPDGADSLAVPTWFYGHEPSNLFGTRVAKYFSNSVREDGLLAVAMHGVIFAAGSAGTTQEIFQDATQNHYATFGWVSPMVFFGKARYTEETRLWQTITELSRGRRYAEQLLLSDDPAEVVSFLQTHPPRPSDGGAG
jgi:predicted Rossmann-fold nucleotide-binding protein